VLDTVAMSQLSIPCGRAHQKYTDNTKAFVEWLGQTALTTCGIYPRTKPTKQSSEADSEPSSKYKVPLSEYLRLAQAIVARRPIVVFPQTVQDTLESMIADRKKFAAHYSGRAYSKTSNRDHWAAIGYFEGAMTILVVNSESKIRSENSNNKAF
jgi:hypothetical protein